MKRSSESDGLRRNGSGRRTRFGCSKKERLRSVKQACSRTSKTPALIDLCAERITVDARSEEQTSELQSHSFISYPVFCLKKKKKKTGLRVRGTWTVERHGMRREDAL